MLKNLRNSFLKLELWALTVGIVVMIVVGTLQVVLRNFFNTGVDWGDMLVRTLVLWVGFAGASLATRKGKHINIEVASKISKNPKFLYIREKIVAVISLFISLLLLKTAIDFTLLEAADNMTAFLNIPTWIVFIIVPISLFIMSIRLLIQVFTGTPDEDDAHSEGHGEGAST
ncbi:MAG: TRAP transporter small permease [Pseudomonadota bacterium]